MSRTLRVSSDPLFRRSANCEEHIIRGAAQAAREAPARPASARTPAARFAAREVQALRTARLSLRQRSWPRPQALFVDQHDKSTSTNRLRAKRRFQQSQRVPRQLPQSARCAQRDLRHQHRAFAPPRGTRLNGSGHRRTRLNQGGRHSRRYGRILSCCRHSTVAARRSRS